VLQHTRGKTSLADISAPIWLTPILADIQEVFEPAPTAARWSQAPRELRTAQTVESGRGRLEKRKLTASTFLNDYSDWLGLAQVYRLERQAVLTPTGEIRQEVVFGVTSYPRSRQQPASY
jgi:hypothetical protein